MLLRNPCLSSLVSLRDQSHSTRVDSNLPDYNCWNADMLQYLKACWLDATQDGRSLGNGCWEDRLWVTTATMSPVQRSGCYRRKCRLE